MNSNAYVDGSFSPSRKKYGSGVVLLFEDGRQFKIFYGGVLMDKDKQKNGSLIGELKAAEIAVSHALEMGSSHIRIFHDCMPVQQYAVTPPKDDSPEEIKAYNKRMSEFMKHINISFEHVKAHSGNRYNMLADREARIGAGITACGIEDQTMAEKALNEKTDDLLQKYDDEDNIREMSPLKIYTYADASKSSIRFSITESKKDEELKLVVSGAVSGNDPAELMCEKIMDVCSRRIDEGIKNITVFTGFRNIVKYGSKFVNQNSRAVSDHYKKFSAFCTEARKNIYLNIETAEEEEDVKKYAETEAMAKSFMAEEKSDDMAKAIKGVESTAELIKAGDDDESSPVSVKIYAHTITKNGMTAYSVIRFAEGKSDVLSLGSSVSPELSSDPAGFICEVLMDTCQHQIDKGVADITVFSKFSDIVSIASTDALSQQQKTSEHYVRFLEFCRRARKSVSFSVKTPEREEDVRNSYLAVKLNALISGAEKKKSNIEKTFKGGRAVENNEEKEEPMNYEIVETAAKADDSDGEKTDDVMSFLEMSAQISRLQIEIEKVYNAMSDENKERLKKIAGYIAVIS